MIIHEVIENQEGVLINLHGFAW